MIEIKGIIAAMQTPMYEAIVLYNIPARTGAVLAPATVGKLVDISNIVGVKDSSGNFNNILQYIDATKGKEFSVLSGNDALILWTLMAGGITAIANILPEVMVSIYQKFIIGDIEGAKEAIMDTIDKYYSQYKI